MPEAPNPNKPTPVDETIVVPPLALSESQDFPLEIVVSGKSKDIELPNDRVISVFPGEEATLTNLDDPSHSLTLNITGSFHETTLEDGSVLTEFNGRNLLADPFIDDGEPGFVLAIGHFSIIVDAAGNLVQPDVITGVAAWIEATNFKGHMHYYFEEGTDTEANASYCIAEMMRDPDIGQEACYSGRSFVEKIRTPGAQAADILAWHAGQDCKRALRGDPVRKDFANLCEIPHRVVHLTREKLQERARIIKSELEAAGLTNEMADVIDEIARRLPKHIRRKLQMI